MMARIKYNGTVPAAPPADSYWLPGEERDFDDDDEQVERLQRNPIFTQVKQLKRPPAEGEAPPEPEAAPAPTEASDAPQSDAGEPVEAAPAEAPAEEEGS
jgi:hypothetical protein